MKENIGIFFDLSKAFDTVDDNILIKNLQLYSVQGNCPNCFQSYLTNWKQYIKRKYFKTEMLNIKYGVPQGSILEPMLFIINISDLFLECL